MDKNTTLCIIFCMTLISGTVIYSESSDYPDDEQVIEGIEVTEIVNSSITGINGTDSVYVTIDQESNTVRLDGYNSEGVQTCWMEQNISADQESIP